MEIFPHYLSRFDFFLNTPKDPIPICNHRHGSSFRVLRIARRKRLYLKELKEMGDLTNMMLTKGLLQSQELYEYILETNVYPREPELLKELRTITASHPRALMGTAPDAGQMLAMLLELVNAKKTIEIGVFTGYSLLLTALTIPDDGKITAIDLDRDAYEMGLPVIKKAGVENKIDFIQSPALPILDKLLEDNDNKESFDFAFIDADKVNYQKYHERLVQLVKVGGIIVYDNTLWSGTVAMPEESVPESLRAVRHHTIEFNKYLAADMRIRLSQVPLGDGITICKRL